MEKRKYRIRRGQKHYLRGVRRSNNVFVAGEIIELFPHQAKQIMDKLIPLDVPQEPGEDPTPDNTAAALTIKHVGGGRFNVIHPETGEPINDSTLTRTEAEALISGGKLKGKSGDDGDADDDDEG